MKAALYARVSTLEQHSENQLVELRRYAAAPRLDRDRIRRRRGEREAIAPGPRRAEGREAPPLRCADRLKTGSTGPQPTALDPHAGRTPGAGRRLHLPQ